MKRFEQHLNSESIQVLEKLVNSNIQSIATSWANGHYENDTITSNNFSFQIGTKQFVLIENDWADTPREAINYFFLSLRIADRPKDIQVKEYKDTWSYFPDHFTLRLGPIDTITRVVVLQDIFEGLEESVDYDAGILIELRSCKRILFVREDSISGFIRLVKNQEHISDLINELEVRLTFPS